MPTNKSTAYHKSKTATADTAFQVESYGAEEGGTFLKSANFHCYTNDLYYGSSSGQEGIIRANAVVWFDNVNVADWWFKNVTAGSNGKIVIIGTRA